MNYQLVNDDAGDLIAIKRIDAEGDHFIPLDDGNRDYQAYQAWVDAGNEPLPAE
jgi:hypothetical protein